MQPQQTLENAKINLRSAVIGLGICVSIIGSAIGATWWTSGKLNSINNNLDNNAMKVSELAASLEDVKSNSYTLAKASEIALREAIENPGTRKVDPRDPSKIIVVNSGWHGGAGDASEPHR